MRIVLFIPLFLCCWQLAAQQVTDTVRIMSYNTLKFDVTGNGKEAHFRTVLNYVQPDILVVQELMESPGAIRFRDSVVLAVDTGYSMAPFSDGYDTDNGLFYRTELFTCLSNTAIITELRDINEFHLQHLASGLDLYVYSVHLKASSGGENAAQREREVDSLRKRTLLLPEDAHFLVCGDFNMYGSYESGYAALTDTLSPGYFIDVLQDSLTSTWNNAANTKYHTQSTRLDAFGGGATGGLDDRFDMMLYSPAMLDTSGIYYVSGSMRPVGNDGAHYNQAIHIPENLSAPSEVINAIYFASDHLPLTGLFAFKWITPEDTTNDTTHTSIQTHVPEFFLYPNPADKYIQIVHSTVPARLQCYDQHGRLMHTEYIHEAGVHSLSIEAWTSGVYLIRIITKAGVGQKSFIKR